MKTRKTVIAVLTAVLVISAVLIAGCIDPLEQAAVKQKAADSDELGDAEAPEIDSNFKIPLGKGVVRFKISDENIRTVMPTPVAANTLYYDIEFTKIIVPDTTYGTTLYYPSTDGTGTTSSGVKLAYGAINTTPLPLSSGNYIVSITAYNNATGTIAMAGWENAETAPVVVGTSVTNVNANLLPITGTGNGTFAYSVAGLDGDPYTTQTLEIRNYSTDALVGSVIVLEDGTNMSDSIPVLSGHYVVKVTAAEEYYQTRQYVRVVHIYPGMTTTMPTVTVAPLVKNTFKVSIDANLISGDSNTNMSFDDDDQFILYGLYATDPGTPASNDGHSWIEWNTADDGNGDTWTFATSRVLNDVTLYGVWLTAGSTGTTTYTLTFTFADQGSASAANDDDGNPTISRSFASSETITLTLDPPSTGGGTWSNIKWYVGGKTYVAGSSSFVVDGDLIINKSGEFNGILAGSGDIIYEVTVSATLTGNSVPSNNGDYSAEVEITVKDAL